MEAQFDHSQSLKRISSLKFRDSVDKAFAPDELIADKVDGKQITVARTRTNFWNRAWNMDTFYNEKPSKDENLNI